MTDDEEPGWHDDRRCHCGTLLGPQIGRGRIRKYCSAACSQAAYRRRQADPFAAWLKAQVTELRTGRERG